MTVFTPQNNRLQELPYNELSRLSALRTLDLHGNLITSEGEGLKLGTTRSQPLSTSAKRLPVVASSWGFPQLLSTVEFRGLWLLSKDRMWRLGWGESLGIYASP